MNKNINVISMEASPLKGEMIFIEIDVLNISILGYLKNKAIFLYKNIKKVLKDKRKRQLIILISVIWLFLIIVKSLNINFFLIDIISYLTFADAAVGGGIMSILGRLIGKTIFAYFIATLISQKKKNFNVIKYIKNFIEIFNIKDKEFIVFSLIGIGLALIIYNFISGGAFKNSIIGVVPILLLLKALHSKIDITREFLHLLLNKTRIMKEFSNNNLNNVVIGCIMGFALGILISLIAVNLCYFIGLISLVIGILANLIMKKHPETT